MLTERLDAGSFPVATPRLRNPPSSPAQAGGKTHVLLLQGPVGSFFAKLQDQLLDAGMGVTRVTFNRGDRADAGRRPCLRYTSTLGGFEQWLRHLMLTRAFTSIVLFGAERPLHIVARRLARSWGIPVLCLEEGYIRSGYVTAEFGGNNWQSPIAGLLPPEFEGPDTAEREHPRNYNSFGAMCRFAARYFVQRRLGASRSMKGCFHKSRPLHSESFYWMRNYWRYKVGHGRNFRTVEKLLEHHDGQFFIMPLQVRDDSQLGVAASSWNSHKMIEATIASFARNARQQSQLVFKIHPLERGHSNQFSLIAQTAALHGVQDRVHTLDSGSLGLLVRHSAGMITINSTSGLSAIAHNRPLLVLGQALYRNPNLAVCYESPADMDGFWKAAHLRPARLAHAYIAWVKSRSLVPGDFYVPAGQLVACEHIVARLIAETARLDEAAPMAANARLILTA